MTDSKQRVSDERLRNGIAEYELETQKDFDDANKDPGTRAVNAEYLRYIQDCLDVLLDLRDARAEIERLRERINWAAGELINDRPLPEVANALIRDPGRTEWQSTIDEQDRLITALEGAVRKARREALTEAMEVCDGVRGSFNDGDISPPPEAFDFAPDAFDFAVKKCRIAIQRIRDSEGLTK
jgi:hypothetical protein